MADSGTWPAFVAKVIAGELHDRVLVSQLRAGFTVRGILPGYLHDWRSRHYATLLEWQNPDYVASRPSVLARRLREVGSTDPAGR